MNAAMKSLLLPNAIFWESHRNDKCNCSHGKRQAISPNARGICSPCTKKSRGQTHTHSQRGCVFWVMSYHKALLPHSDSNWEQAAAAWKPIKTINWDQTGSCCRKHLPTWKYVAVAAAEEPCFASDCHRSALKHLITAKR